MLGGCVDTRPWGHLGNAAVDPGGARRHDLGLNDLYWHADPWAQFGAGLSVMAVTLVMFFLGFLLDEQAGLTAQSMRALHARKKH